MKILSFMCLFGLFTATACMSDPNGTDSFKSSMRESDRGASEPVEKKKDRNNNDRDNMSDTLEKM